MKTNILKLVKWFCRKLTYNELASAILIIHEVLSNRRADIELKPEPKPPHYRKFKVSTIRPLTKPQDLPLPSPREDWQTLKANKEQKTGKIIHPVRRRKNSAGPPSYCTCTHCGAPTRYLYLNDGKKANQVRCKICGRLSPTNRVRRESNAKYFCPYCNSAMYKWKTSPMSITFKCPSDKCPFYLKNLNSLSPEEHQIRASGNTSQFKIRYQYREYHFSPDNIKCACLTPVSQQDLSNIRKNIHTVSLVLTYFVNIGLSSRQTRHALAKIHNIDISHQTVINYANASAAVLADFVDKHLPTPTATVAGDETYITVENKTHYTWFNLDSKSRAICGFNLSDKRDFQACLALQYNTFGPPETNKGKQFSYVADGLPSYDGAVIAYNSVTNEDIILRHTVIGLENINPESKELRPFKQMIERLNRTYKYHTRPRAGFKSFDGALALTILFVAFYNFMRPHSALNGKPPVQIECLRYIDLYPHMWTELLKQVIA